MFLKFWGGGKCPKCTLGCAPDFKPSAHAQNDILGHEFRKRWLLIEISNMLRTDEGLA